jgi:two-component system cell cycle response regulator DivK
MIPAFAQVIRAPFPRAVSWRAGKAYLTLFGSTRRDQSLHRAGAPMGLQMRESRPKSRRPEREMDAKAKTILIVEDNELNMKLFHDLLDAHGYKTIQTRDGLEALDLARKHVPDLILMDIQLPEVSGLEVTKWLKEDEGLKAIPVIAVTAFAMKGDEEKIRQGGCEAYISKPISVMHFLETIRRFLA